LPIVRQDEIGQLIGGFNHLLEILGQREILLKQILDTSSVAIFLVNKEGRITQANRRMAEMFDWPLDALEGAEYVALIHPSEREVGRQNMLALLASAIPSVDLERLYWRADHTEFWGQLTGQRFIDASGEEHGLVGVIADITVRKRTEEALRRQNNLLSAIFENFPGGISVFDAELRLTAHNNQLKRMLDLPDALFEKPHTCFEDFIRYNAQRGDYGPGDPEEQVAANVARARNFQPHTIERVLPNGMALEIRGTPLPDGGFVTVYLDITERKQMEEQVRQLAFYDTLTQLPNRRLLNDRLIQAMATSNRCGCYGALLFLDLDHFKTLNDTLGHDKGDLLLQQVAQRLVTCVREGDTVARLGGDEFVVMLEGLSEHPEEAATQTEMVGEKILATLNQPYRLSGHENRSTPSIGVTLFGGHQTSIDELLKQADLAMYQSKTAGRNTLRFFDPKMQALVSERAALEVDLREAMRLQQFMLYYQPQVIGDGRITGAEALLRWQHPQRGLVSPADFIPLAEESGLILPLGHWVLETACTQLALWAGWPEMAHLTVAVNVSTRQFRHPDFVDQVLAVLGKTGANPHRLKLELTESLLVENVQEVIAKMVALKSRGVGFSLDDFGTGYSSLSYLKRLPLDQLKIDQSFVSDVLTDPNDAAIAKTIIALAQSLGLGVIAEGVETEGQRNFLADHGCDAYQGYLFSRPLPLEAFQAFVRRA
jgi:diguanylate cyclase (GGDEF)-like protein/PAS domain S-box-containing protein